VKDARVDLVGEDVPLVFVLLHHPQLDEFVKVMKRHRWT
jgi:hypothetical protein